MPLWNTSRKNLPSRFILDEKPSGDRGFFVVGLKFSDFIFGLHKK